MGTSGRMRPRTLGVRVAGRSVMRRVFVGLLAVAAVLTLLFYLGGGWYFAGQINATGLQVRPAEQNRTLDVVDAGRGWVRLVETDGDSEALSSRRTYGLDWPGGYGQISGAPLGEDNGARGVAVTRRLTLLRGQAPRRDDMADLNRDAYPPADPALALGRPVRQVEYRSPAGAFPAWFVPGHDNTWAIFTHGALGATRAEALRAMRTTVDLGLPSLAITYRNDPGTPADPSGRWGYGRTEWRDLEGAVGYALDHGASDVVLVGYSMGGAITASFLTHSPLARHVSGLVLDGPMLDFAETVDYGASQRTLPVVGGQVPPSLAWTARQIAAVRYDLDWDATDYLDDTSWLRIPTLVFHGTQDTRVPLSTSRTLRRDHPKLVHLQVIAGAGHVEAWNQDPTAYDQALRAFLR